jgi:hypothetical protein
MIIKPKLNTKVQEINKYRSIMNNHAIADISKCHTDLAYNETGIACCPGNAHRCHGGDANYYGNMAKCHANDACFHADMAISVMNVAE